MPDLGSAKSASSVSQSEASLSGSLEIGSDCIGCEAGTAPAHMTVDIDGSGSYDGTYSLARFIFYTPIHCCWTFQGKDWCNGNTPDDVVLTVGLGQFLFSESPRVFHWRLLGSFSGKGPAWDPLYQRWWTFKNVLSFHVDLGFDPPDCSTFNHLLLPFEHASNTYCLTCGGYSGFNVWPDGFDFRVTSG
jgi:hypothetical protein